MRTHLLGTLPGRLLLVGAIVKLLTWLLRTVGGVEVPLIDGIGAIGSLAVIAGAAYFFYRLIVRAKRRLLWRVRRKLILSYIFVGVVPVLLVFAFFALAGLLLFFNVGAYLVASGVRGVSDNALAAARTTVADLDAEQWLRARIAAASSAKRPRAPAPGTPQAADEKTLDLKPADLNAVHDVLERRRASLAREYPDASVALVATPSEPCAGAAALTAPNAAAVTKAVPARLPGVAVGPWLHLPPPPVVPEWISCSGWSGLLAVAVPQSRDNVGLMIRAVAMPPAATPVYAVVIDIPLDAIVKAGIREQTTVKLGPVSLPQTSGKPDEARPVVDVGPNAASLLAVATGGDLVAKRRFPWVASLEWRDWASGKSGVAAMNIEMNLGEIYDRVSSSQAGGSAIGIRIVMLLGMIAVLFLIIEAVALIMGLVLARSITGSVHQLFSGTERVREGDFGHKIKILTRDQMGDLAESFNTMTSSIVDLLRQAAEKKRLEEELRIARAIQMSLLPRGELSVPGLSITALCVPAREVGGDYYDVLPLDDHRLGVLIADVAGKGTSAALYMAELKGLILSLCRIHQSPRQLLIEANRIIADNLDSRSFITMMYAVIDLQARTMTYARAGHTPLIHRTINGRAGQVQVLVPDGLVVGLNMGDGGALFERLLKQEEIALHEGDLFMFFTDGVTEAMNAESDCFGDTRLAEILTEHGDLPSEELRERILREVDAFVAGAPQHDDMTMILVKVESVGATVLGMPAVGAAARPVPSSRA